MRNRGSLRRLVLSLGTMLASLPLAGSALGQEGLVFAWGNEYFQFGLWDVPEPNQGYVEISMALGHCLGLRANSSIVAWGGQ